MKVSTWKKETFSDLIKAGLLMIGDGYRAKNEELGGDGYIFLRAGHVTDTHIDLSGIERFRENLSDKVASKLSKTGDVVITTKGNSTGRVTYMTPDLPQVVYSPHLSFWRSLNHNLLVPGFLRYWSRSREFHTQLEGLKASTDMAPYLSLIDQKRLQVTLPPPEDQKSIARILGALDNKIELDRQMNRTLEAMAQALFKSWFVDFDPVTAKAAGRKPYGTDEATTALFPDRFVESELGLIPEGWGTSTVGVEYNLTMGQSPPGNTYNETGEGLPFYQGRTDFTFRFPVRRIYCTAPTRFAEEGDTLVSVRAPVGDVNMASEKCAIGRGVAAIRHKSGSESYTYYAMRFLKQEFDVFEGEGTLFGAIGRTGFERIALITPPSTLVEKFEAIYSPLDKSIKNNEEESQTLAALRDALLPKLLSGVISVREAEREMEQVV